jgi:hypothetical protein
MLARLEIAGAPYEMGLARGRELRHLIAAGVKLLCQRFHDPQHQALLREITDRHLARHREAFPHVVEEMRGVADGAGLPFADVAAVALRAYNNVTADLPETPEDCFSVAVADSDRGPLHGGALECVPWAYVIETMRPSDGFSFVHVTWAGTPWGVRGMNEHGLSIGQASVRLGPRTRPHAPKLRHDKPFVLCYWLLRECLQRCRTTAEALDFVADYDFITNVIFADAQGDLAALEAAPGVQVVRRPGADGAVYCASVFVEPGMLQTLERHGFDYHGQPLVGPATERINRFRTRVAAAAGAFTWEWLAALLRDHEGTPETRFCSDANVCSTIAAPREGKFYVVEGFPCQHEFVPCSLSGPG